MVLNLGCSSRICHYLSVFLEFVCISCYICHNHDTLFVCVFFVCIICLFLSIFCLHKLSKKLISKTFPFPHDRCQQLLKPKLTATYLPQQTLANNHPSSGISLQSSKRFHCLYAFKNTGSSHRNLPPSNPSVDP
jgi:hypothetical protein